MSDTDRLLNDIRVYLRIAAASASKVVASKVIDTQEKAMVYDRLDGETPQLKIESTTKVPQRTISGWVDKFVEAGLVSPPDKYCKNYKALFALRELGISLSELKKRKKKQQAVQTETGEKNTEDTKKASQSTLLTSEK